MVEACTKANSTEATVAMAVSKGIGEAILNMNTVHCFGCGQMGHIQAHIGPRSGGTILMFPPPEAVL